MNIEPIDYQQLYQAGVKNLAKFVDQKKANHYLKYSNLESVLPFISEYLKGVKHETRQALFSEIANFLDEGWLIGTEINGFFLNHLSGYGFHFILIYDFDGENFYVHDPGLPPTPARQIPASDLADCFTRSQVNALTLFRKKNTNSVSVV